jgi:hypothetical protein
MRTLRDELSVDIGRYTPGSLLNHILYISETLVLLFLSIVTGTIGCVHRV